MKPFKFLAAGLLTAFVFTGQVWGLNIGGNSSSGAAQGTAQDSGESQGNGKTEVTNLPIQVMVKKIDNEDKEIPYMRVTASDYFVQEIAKDIALGNGETYESDPFDVREYKEVSFYVVPDSVLGGTADVIYQLDAFFSITSSAQKVQKMGEKAGSISNGWQEFGSMEADEKGKEYQSSFHKLTTGSTSTRVLSTKIYGPFVHVVLKNLSPDSKRRFKIIAYLSR